MPLRYVLVYAYRRCVCTYVLRALTPPLVSGEEGRDNSDVYVCLSCLPASASVGTRALYLHTSDPDEAEPYIRIPPI